MIKPNPKTITISEKFHNETSIHKFPQKTLDPKHWPSSWKKIYAKNYFRLASIQLPKKLPVLEPSLGKILLARKSERSFNNDYLCLSDLGTLLFYSAGVKPDGKNWDESTRFYPSAGGRYPLELYLIANKISELKNGLYHYSPKLHALETLLIQKDISSLIAKLVGQKWVSNSQAVLIITAVKGRTQVKYGDRGYRHILIEAGHLGQNIYLVAKALKMKCCAIGGFIDEEVNRLLDIDDESEITVYIIAVGK